MVWAVENNPCQIIAFHSNKRMAARSGCWSDGGVDDTGEQHGFSHHGAVARTCSAFFCCIRWRAVLNHACQPAVTPYRASHAIFVREGATQAYDAVNQVAESMRLRLLSLRAYAADGMMLDAEVVDGTVVEAVIAQLFGNADVSDIHIHNAKRGCYAARIDRA